jgi:preprotein translocase subunit YajC
VSLFFFFSQQKRNQQTLKKKKNMQQVIKYGTGLVAVGISTSIELAGKWKTKSVNETYKFTNRRNVD